MGLSKIDQDRLRAPRWNLLRAALYGCIAGGVVSVFDLMQDGRAYPVEYWIGALIGGMVGGAVLFGLIAGLRNLVLRAR